MTASTFKPQCSLNKKEIQTIFKLGKRVLRSDGLDIIVHPSLSAFGRILVVTSRKTGSAPWRNKARRRIKAIFFTHNLAAAGLDAIVIMKKPGLAYSYQQLEQLICPLFAPNS
jgi:ribonuclease P protein component